MKHIGEVMRDSNIADLVASVTAKREARRQAGIEQYGWDVDCVCDYCGDTGVDPETARVCNCEVGRNLETARRLERDWHTFVPWRFKDFRLETHPNRRAAKEVQEWVASGFDNRENLMLVGPVGSGKTGLAIGAMREIYMTDAVCRFDTFSGYLDQLRPKDTPSLDALEMDHLTSAGLLVIDDLGTQKMTDWVAERLYLIVNDRYQNGLPMIVTTNLTGDELDRMLGERIMSRLSTSSRMVAVGGSDLRKRGAA